MKTKLAAALLAFLTLLTATVLFPAQASARPSTRGFWIDNVSSKRLKLTAVKILDGQDNTELLPLNYVIAPGATSDSQLDSGTRRINRVDYNFDVLDADGSVFARITVRMFLDELGIRFQGVIKNEPAKVGAKPMITSGTERTGTAYKGSLLETMGAKSGQLIDGQNIGIYDPAGTTYDGTKLSAIDQGEILGNMCARDAAVCRFVIASDAEKRRSDVEYIGGQFPNRTCDNQEFSVNTTDSRTVTHSWEIGASFKSGVDKIWEASVSVKYGGSVSDRVEFSASRRMTVRPGYNGYFASTVPIVRYRGTWTIQIRRDGTGPVLTTITIAGTIDIPDARSANGKQAEVAGVSEPLTDQERAMVETNCKPLPK